MKPIATPFRVDREGCIVSARTGAQIAHIVKPGTVESEVTAEFIVSACNAHGDLIAALKRATDLLARYPKHDDAWRECCAALAKARP
jgi:hypothetical protein